MTAQIHLEWKEFVIAQMKLIMIKARPNSAYVAASVATPQTSTFTNDLLLLSSEIYAQ